MKLQGKSVLITGGSSGIGLATARLMFARGARVVITGRRQEQLAAAADDLLSKDGYQPGLVNADVATAEGRAATLSATLRQLGGLDVLVNNAGGVRAGRLDDMSEAEIQAMIEVDLVAPILLTRAALPYLRGSGEGMVVNVASGLAQIGMPFYAAYAGAKAGLARFGEAMRRELKDEGVHVLTVYPGATDTPMMATARGAAPRESPAAVAEAIVAGIEADALEVVRGGEARAAMLALNRDDPAALDRQLLSRKAALAEASRDHSAL